VATVLVFNVNVGHDCQQSVMQCNAMRKWRSAKGSIKECRERVPCIDIQLVKRLHSTPQPLEDSKRLPFLGKVKIGFACRTRVKAVAEGEEHRNKITL
jgi:hypothetical protein